MRLSQIITVFESDYLRHYKKTMLPSHRHALARLKDCRSEYSPMMKLECTDCNKIAYLPHSCGYRNCPHCQHHESQVWINNQLKRRVKGNYVLTTFTLPAEFRPLVFSHQRKLYTLMFAVIWEILQSFSQNDKDLQGIPGVIAVLHTHSRRLDFHPHIHIIMPMGAVNKKQGLWREKSGNYLFNHKALAKVFRPKMLAGIQLLGLNLPVKYPRKWVVDCKAVGEGSKAITYLGGSKAITYLGRYLYRGVIQEKDILKVENANVTFRYIDSETKKEETRTVSGEKFLWLLMQHVLPKGFRRSRNYGFLHPNSKLLKQIQLITRVLISPPKPKKRAEISCSCGGVMKIVETRIKNTKYRWQQQPALKQQGATI